MDEEEGCMAGGVYVDVFCWNVGRLDSDRHEDDRRCTIRLYKAKKNVRMCDAEDIHLEVTQPVT